MAAKRVPKYPGSVFSSSDEARRFAEKHELMPFQEVADRWFEMSGERLSRSRICQLTRIAEAKIAEALGEFEELL